MLRFNLTQSLILLMSLSITFYAAQITSFSPIYFIYLFALFLSIAVMFRYSKVIVTGDILIALTLLVYILVTQFQYFMSGEFINILIGLSAYLFIRAKQNELDITYLLKTFNYMIWVSIVVLSIDSAYRLTHPGAPSKEAVRYLLHSDELWFYLYKYNSIIFADSNTTGLIVLILFFSIITIEKYINKKEFYYNYAKIILFILMLGTLSRAVIVAFFIGFLSSIYNKKKIYAKIIYAIIGLFLVGAVLILMSAYLSHDGSLATKFKIVYLVYDNLKGESLFNIMFGQGLGQAKVNLGIYSHLLLLTFVVEMGVVGLLIFLLFVGYYIYKYNALIWVPVMVVSLSYFLYVGTPFLFVPLALCANILDKSREKHRIRIRGH